MAAGGTSKGNGSQSGGRRGGGRGSDGWGGGRDQTQARDPAGPNGGISGGSENGPGAKSRNGGGRATTKTPTPPELKAFMTVIGALSSPPLGAMMKVGDYMGERVGELQANVDAGRVRSRRADDSQMGRVDVVGGRPNSFGNAMGDDRAANRNGLGGGTTGGSGGKGSDEEERRKRRLAAQQTALGSDSTSLLGPGVLPI